MNSQPPNPNQPSFAHRVEENVVALLGALEAISRTRPDRVLRLRGQLAVDGERNPVDGPLVSALAMEPFELIIFQGFSSSITHPTAFDPDRPALPEGAKIETAELLEAPLDPREEQRLAAPQPPEVFLSPAAW